MSSDSSLLAKCSSHRCRWDRSFKGRDYLSHFSIIVCSMLLNFAVVGMELCELAGDGSDGACASAHQILVVCI